MADLHFLKSHTKPIAVLGLGISGQGVADACLQAGVKFHAWDESFAARNALADKYPLHDFTQNLGDYAMLIRASGIKPSNPIIKAAQTQNIPIYSDIDLLLESAQRAKVIAITGTNGKSTTTALVDHMLTAHDIKHAMGGNIGRGACTLPSLDDGGVYVLELSSYQLAVTQTQVADIAVYLNLTPDHLEWHGTMDQYASAKERIFRLRGADGHQTAIIGLDTPATAALAQKYTASLSHKVVTIATTGDAIIAVKNGVLYDHDRAVANLNNHAYLQGAHNHQNLAAAYAVGRALGLPATSIIDALMGFTGLAHRQKNIGAWQHITFINDSKATNADSAAQALMTFNNIYWIVGGMAKDDGIDGLEKYYPRIRKAFLIGDATERFAQKLDGVLPYQKCQTLERATLAAFEAAQRDAPHAAIVLLSPACASFDQYKSFEQRGAAFEDCVRTLIARDVA